MKKAPLLGVVLLFAPVSLGCSSGHTWSEELRDIYTEECVQGVESDATLHPVADDLCECLLNKWQANYSEEEYNALSATESVEIGEEYGNECYEEVVE